MSHVTAAVVSLQKAGATTLVVAGMPDLGRIPYAYSSRSPISRRNFTRASKNFNRTLRKRLDARVPNHRWMDAFALSSDLISNPRRYGFWNSRKNCLQTVKCNDPDRYVFYDDRHPSSAAHSLIASAFWHALNQN